MEKKEFLVDSILRDMSEGVMVIGLDGIIEYANYGLEKILNRTADELVGNKFAACFFEFEENDEFNQAIMDAIYENTKVHENIVKYYDGSKFRTLHVRDSFKMDGEEKVAIIAVISDISELAELRDAVKAMERIKALNKQLEMRNKLISETFGRFLSDDIVRELLDTPDGLALGGKKKSLTVMMSDLRGFTSISEKMPPDDLLNMLNHYLGAMTDIIQGNNGTIIEFIGDGIMAIFGAPVRTEYYARDAVVAAVKMQKAMTEINEWNEERGYPRLEMGIGINTSEVIVGNIGSEKRTKYGVAGSGVNLAGRIESYTVGGHILIDPDTREEAGLSLKVADEFQIMPKGVATPLVITRVAGIGEPYNIYLNEDENEMTELTEELAVTYRRLHEKHVGMHEHTLIFTAVSKEEGQAKYTDDLKLFDNIVLDIGDKLYGKVVSVSGDSMRIRYTAKPECFDEWLSEMSHR